METLFDLPDVQPASFAVISEDERYRYVLGRRWGDGKTLHVVMLNPSTANAEDDDPTIRKIRGFAKLNGFEAFEVRNLFAWRATNPRELLYAGGRFDPVGPDNDAHLRAIPAEGEVLCAWGSFPYAQPSLHWRTRVAFQILQNHRLLCVKRTEDRPWHPLYVKYGAFEPFSR